MVLPNAQTVLTLHFPLVKSQGILPSAFFC